MIKTSLLSTFIAISLLFSACSKEKKEVTEDANSMLSTNEFVLTSLAKTQYVVKKTDEGFSVDGAKGKVVIFDIFGTWCPPCQAEASHLTSLQNKYKDSLLVLGISVDNNIPNSKLEDFRSKYNAQYTLVNSSENSRIISAVATRLNLGRDFGIPLMVMYKDGKFVNMYQGATEEEFIESDIKKALGK